MSVFINFHGVTGVRAEFHQCADIFWVYLVLSRDAKWDQQGAVTLFFREEKMARDFVRAVNSVALAYGIDTEYNHDENEPEEEESYDEEHQSIPPKLC